MADWQSRLGGVALAWLTPRMAWADHGGGGPPASGGLGFAWLLVAGGVLALVLGAWALLAPGRKDDDSSTREARRS